MSKTNPVAVGLIGCGNISSIYLQNAQTLDADRDRRLRRHAP